MDGHFEYCHLVCENTLETLVADKLQIIDDPRNQFNLVMNTAHAKGLALLYAKTPGHT